MKSPNDPFVPGPADPNATLPPAETGEGKESSRAVRPQRRAHLVIEVEADTPDELLRSLKRAVSRISIGSENWIESTTTTTGIARLRIDPDALCGDEHLAAFSEWDKKQPRRKAR